MGCSERPINALWAKKEERNGRFYWLPLKVHLTDTMNVSRWLWNTWLSDSQREFCVKSISFGDEETAADLASFLGAVHDIGKATPAFQTKKGFANSPDLDNRLLEKMEMAGFPGISSLNLADPQKTHHSLAGEYILTGFNINQDIGSIVGGHHGKPVDDKLQIDNQFAYEANYYQVEDQNSEINGKWKLVHQELFRWALDVSGLGSVDKIPEMTQTAQVIYAGLLVMADWIASNSEYFPLLDINEENVPDVAARYKIGLSAWGKSQPLQMTSYPPMQELFVRRFGFAPRDFQRVVYDTINQTEKPGIIILEAPMGLGKTEAALAAAEIVSAKKGNSGLFFGLPTQATSNGMFGRIHDWLETLTSEYGVSQSLRLCHGKAALNEDMNELRSMTSAQSVNIDEESMGHVFVNEWFSGRKKSVLDDFVVGTVDGFLLSALKQKHLYLRHLGFSKKTVIIDEVHAYDTYMQQYLEEAIRWMGAYGTPVILVSATLPREKRISFIESYLQGSGKKKRDICMPEEIAGTSYPMISYTDGDVVNVQTDFSEIRDKVVHVKRISEVELTSTVDDLLEGGGVVGIIVNTVRKAQELGKQFKAVYGENNVEVLHSAFVATDRIEKEKQLLCMIGKHAERPKRKIVIGTQVIEQSLDIDFDVLITDLCPMDLLLQRVGRLHRHNIIRSQKHIDPVVYVMGTSDQLEFEKGSEHIYEKYYLIRTQCCLQKEIRIPSDIPILISKVYGNAPLELSEEKRHVYEESFEKMKITKKNKSDKAQTYRIDDPRVKMNPDKNNLISWLRNPDFSDNEELAVAQVRDIQETVEVVAVKRIGNGYGTFQKEEDISDQISEPRIAKEIAKQTLRLPNFITAKEGVSKTIDFLEEYNRRELPEWQNQPWLKGMLGIIFDEKGRFTLRGYNLKYDSEFGIREEQEDGEI